MRWTAWGSSGHSGQEADRGASGCDGADQEVNHVEGGDSRAGVGADSRAAWRAVDGGVDMDKDPRVAWRVSVDGLSWQAANRRGKLRDRYDALSHLFTTNTDHSQDTWVHCLGGGGRHSPGPGD